MATFFEANSPFGELTDWEPQTGGGPTDTVTRASALGKDGDEFRHKDHDAKSTVSCTYTAKKTSGNFAVPSVGAVVGGYVVESISVTYGAQAFPTLTVSGHKHTNSGDASGAHSGMRTYSPSIQLPAVAFGVPSALGSLISCDGARSLTYSLSCTHIDEMGGAGVLVGADNHDGVENITVESVETVTLTDTDSAWTTDSKAVNKANNAATATSYSYTKHIAHDVASEE